VTEERATYAGSGVDLDAAEAAVAAIRPHVERTHGREVLESIGGFGGLFRFDTRRYKRPVLVSAADGVGTKLELARQLGRFDTIGVDLVAMVVDDIVTTGATLRESTRVLSASGVQACGAAVVATARQ
jgi:phosphoribosylformylglycinamidine cyclo-ligase